MEKPPLRGSIRFIQGSYAVGTHIAHSLSIASVTYVLIKSNSNYSLFLILKGTSSIWSL